MNPVPRHCLPQSVHMEIKMTRMLRRIVMPLFLIGLSLCNQGCPVVVAGAGVGAGAYVYMQGELKRTYAAPLDRTVHACNKSLEALKMSIQETGTEGFTTIVKATQADGTPVTVKLTSLSEDQTEVSVRAGSVGVWDKQVAELVHATIANKL